MKSFVMLFFVIGIVMLSLGYQKKILTNTRTEKVIEYRYIPTSIYDEQLSQSNLQQTFHDMFNKQDIFINRDDPILDLETSN
jgi:hypothetical protein